MPHLAGSLRFVDLSAVTELLAELGSTGRLCVTHADWTGEIVIQKGVIVEAWLDGERGRAALEAIALALPEGRFSFVDEPPAGRKHSSPALVGPEERRAYLDRLGAEHERISRLIPSLTLVPQLVETSEGDPPDTQITIGAAALQLIPTLVFGHSLVQLATQRGVARTLREMAILIQGGLVKLEPASMPRSAEAIPQKPHHLLPDTPAPARVQPLSARPTALRFVPRRADALVVAPATPVPVEPLARPVSTPALAALPPAVAARLATVGSSRVPQPPTPSWRKTLTRFFLHDDRSTA